MVVENSVFAKIVRGEISCYKVYEDDYVLSFMNINPVRPGHVLVIPKRRPKQFVFQLDDEMTCKLFSACAKIANALRFAYGCHRVQYVVDGDQVPYAHVHLIPRELDDGLNFWPVSYKASDQELVEESKKISSFV